MRKQPPTCARIDAVSGNNQIIVGAAAIAEEDARLNAIRVNLLGRDAQPQVHLERSQPIGKDLVQGRPQDSAGAWNVAKGLAARVDREHWRAICAAYVDTVCDVALLPHRIKNAEALHGTQRRSGNGDSGPINSPLRVALAEIDGNSRLAQRDCRGHAGDAAADDENGVALTHWRRPSALHNGRCQCRCTSH
jgi:hypothetical protein